MNFNSSNFIIIVIMIMIMIIVIFAIFIHEDKLESHRLLFHFKLLKRTPVYTASLLLTFGGGS